MSDTRTQAGQRTLPCDHLDCVELPSTGAELAGYEFADPWGSTASLDTR